MASDRQLRGCRARLCSGDGRDPVEGAIEARDGRAARALRARGEVCLCEVEAVELVYLESSQDQRLVDDDCRGEANDGADELGDPHAWDLLVRLEYEDDVREHEVGDIELFRVTQEKRR